MRAFGDRGEKVSIISNYGRSFGSYDHDKLIERANRVVCKHCGGKLVTALIVYDIYGGAGEELYCPHCQKQEFGVEQEIYSLAEYYVDNFQFNYFYDMEENEVNFRLNVAKVADMLSWMLKNVGLLTKDGLKNEIPDYAYFKHRRRDKSE